jgi:hypothetical protein
MSVHQQRQSDGARLKMGLMRMASTTWQFLSAATALIQLCMHWYCWEHFVHKPALPCSTAMPSNACSSWWVPSFYLGCCCCLSLIDCCCCGTGSSYLSKGNQSIVHLSGVFMHWLSCPDTSCLRTLAVCHASNHSKSTCHSPHHSATTNPAVTIAIRLRCGAVEAGNATGIATVQRHLRQLCGRRPHCKALSPSDRRERAQG